MILLASSSPTRAKILKNFDIKFIQKQCSFNEETIQENSAKNFVYTSAKGKMTACEKEYGLDIPILCADTVVCAKNKILRKAKDKKEAKEILLSQSGNSVSILTCMMFKTKKLSLIDLSETKYIFDIFDKDDLQKYLETDQWKGKAGACMVEGFCKKYIKKVIGLQSNAMGLQIEKLLPFLKF